eukprot:scaffold97466_cov48-Phaeocystis_antarctica.AAC.1
MSAIEASTAALSAAERAPMQSYRCPMPLFGLKPALATVRWPWLGLEPAFLSAALTMTTLLPCLYYGTSPWRRRVSP